MRLSTTLLYQRDIYSYYKVHQLYLGDLHYTNDYALYFRLDTAL